MKNDFYLPIAKLCLYLGLPFILLGFISWIIQSLWLFNVSMIMGAWMCIAGVVLGTIDKAVNRVGR
jgi:hypothetical protein